MKRVAIVFGGISAVIGILSIVLTLRYLKAGDMRPADVYGWANIVLSALLVFFGIRSQREGEGAGRITFGRGLLVGVLITLVSCAGFMLAFQLVYFRFVPDYGEKYEACMVHRATESGGSTVEIEKARSQAAMFRRLFDNPWTNASVTFASTFPVGLAAAAISAAILRKR